MKQTNRMFANWGVKVMSFIVALLTVFTIEFANITARTVTIPVSVKLPEGMVADSLVPETVDIKISGDEDIIYLVDPAGVRAYADFSGCDSEGIWRVPVMLEYNADIYAKNKLSVTAVPSSLRILFSEAESE